MCAVGGGWGCEANANGGWREAKGQNDASTFRAATEWGARWQRPPPAWLNTGQMQRRRLLPGPLQPSKDPEVGQSVIGHHAAHGRAGRAAQEAVQPAVSGGAGARSQAAQLARGALRGGAAAVAAGQLGAPGVDGEQQGDCQNDQDLEEGEGGVAGGGAGCGCTGWVWVWGGRKRQALVRCAGNTYCRVPAACQAAAPAARSAMP